MGRRAEGPGDGGLGFEAALCPALTPPRCLRAQASPAPRLFNERKTWSGTRPVSFNPGPPQSFSSQVSPTSDCPKPSYGSDFTSLNPRLA